MRKRIIEKNFSVSNVTGTSYSSVIDLDDAATISVQAVIDVNTPAAGTFTAAVTDICTKVASGFITGLKVQVSTSNTLPAGLLASTDYFVYVLDADTFKLSDTLAHAIAGTNFLNITDTGIGVQTITPTSIAGGTWTLQQSNDGTNYSDVASATSVTADAVVFIEKIDPTSKQMRIKCVVTAGMFSVDNHVIVKGEV